MIRMWNSDYLGTQEVMMRTLLSPSVVKGLKTLISSSFFPTQFTRGKGNIVPFFPLL